MATADAVTLLMTAIRLRPDEWRSGEHLWLINAVGDQPAIPHLMQQLQAGPFKGRQAKMRMVGADGKLVVVTVAGMGEGQRVEPASDRGAEA